jgi:hypothetical protein
MLPESPFCTAAQIAEQWKKNVAGLQEYQVIRDGSIFRAHLADSYLFHSEYQQALRLKEELMKPVFLAVLGAGLLPAQVDRIEGSRIAAHMKFLSSDLLEGRAPGTRGGQLTHFSADDSPRLSTSFQESCLSQ